MKISRWIFFGVLVGAFVWFFLSQSETPAVPSSEEKISAAANEPVASRELRKVPQGKDLPPHIEIPPIRQESQTESPPRIEQAALQPSLEPSAQDLLRNEDGILLKTNQAAAAEACTKRGMRLPTAMELARLSQSRGAKGIWEERKTNEGENSADYYLMRAENLQGSMDEFHFNPRGYTAPAGELGNHWFFSSSTDASNKGCAIGLNARNGVLACNGHETEEGHVFDTARDNHSPAFCVK